MAMLEILSGHHAPSYFSNTHGFLNPDGIASR